MYELLSRKFEPADKVMSASQFREDKMPTLILSQGQWLAWDGSSYQPREAATIDQAVPRGSTIKRIP